MKNHKEILRQKVLKHGWIDVAEMIGGFDILYKHAFNNDYNEFLNLFNNLEVVPSEQNSEIILYRFEKGKNMMVYNKKKEYVHINYDVIWLFFDKGIRLNHHEIQDIMEKWLDGVYNLSRINPVSSPEIEYSRWVWSAT
jgi:hypothetical protein